LVFTGLNVNENVETLRRFFKMHIGLFVVKLLLVLNIAYKHYVLNSYAYNFFEKVFDLLPGPQQTILKVSQHINTTSSVLQLFLIYIGFVDNLRSTATMH
jgi:hypothetical protein